MAMDPNAGSERGLSNVFQQGQTTNNGMTGIKPEDIYTALASMQGLFNPQQGGGRPMQPPYSQVTGQAALAQNVMAPAGMPQAALPGLGALLGGGPMGPPMGGRR